MLKSKINLSKKNVICTRYDSQNDKKLVVFKKNGKKYQIIFTKAHIKKIMTK